MKRQREVFYVMCRIGGQSGPERLGGMSFSMDQAHNLAVDYAETDGYFAYSTTIPPRRETPPLVTR